MSGEYASRVLDVVPQLCGSAGVKPLQTAIAEPSRFAIEPKVDGVRGLVVFGERTIETRNRRGERRAWLRAQPLEVALRRLGRQLPILHDGTVIDGELVADRFTGTMAALTGSKRHGGALRFVAFDLAVPGRRRPTRDRGASVGNGWSCSPGRSSRRSSCRP